MLMTQFWIKVFIDRKMLDYRQFTTFIKNRELKIPTELKNKIGIKDEETDYSTIWGE